MNQELQYNSNWINNNYNSQLHNHQIPNQLELNSNIQPHYNLQQPQFLQQQQQQQQQPQQFNSQNYYNSFYNQQQQNINNNNNIHYNPNQNNLNFNFTHNNNFILYDQNISFQQNSFSTMPNNNNTTYYIDNNNNLQLHQPMNNNIYTHTSYPSVMDAHNKMEKQILSHQQQIQNQNQTQTQQQTQVQQLYSNNKNYYSINNSTTNVDCKNKTTTCTYDGNNGYIYNNSNSHSTHNHNNSTTTVSHNVYNSNQSSMQMAQEIPAGQRQQQFQIQQKQIQQNNNNNNNNNNINKQTTIVQQKKLQPINNEKDQQHIKKTQQQQQILIQQHQHLSSIITSSTSSTNSALVEKDLIDKTLEQQQLQIELKITKEERDKIQLQIDHHKQNIENHERVHKKPYLVTSKVNEFFPKVLSLENWNFVGESTSRIYQTLNQRADFHKKSSACRVLLVKKIFSWLISHDKEYIKSHKTVDLVIAISDIINMIISLIELHRAPSNSILYLIIYSSDRFVERTGINHHQIFNLLLTSAIVNLKFWNESLYIQNKTIADIFSFSVKDLNTMERRFLYGLDYNLCVTEDELNKFIDKLKRLTISQSNLIK